MGDFPTGRRRSGRSCEISISLSSFVMMLEAAETVNNPHINWTIEERINSLKLFTKQSKERMLRVQEHAQTLRNSVVIRKINNE